jgi:uncharacterized protein YndB with AHSA1/START domain
VASGRARVTCVEIDRSSPVVFEKEVEIQASPESVWNVLTDVDRWPAWNPDIRSARLNGTFAEGSEFRWKSGPSTITSTVERVDKPRLVGWRGKTLGATAIHVWKLEPTATGTRVRSEESMSGLVPRLFRSSMQRTLEKSLGTWLGEMAKTVETSKPET